MNKVEFQSWVKATVRPVIFLGNAKSVYILLIFSAYFQEKRARKKNQKKSEGKNEFLT